MKQKSTKYLLLVAVLAVWTLVMLRIFSGNTPSTEPVALFNVSTDATIYATADSFELLGNYNDPFLGGKSTSSTPKRRNSFSSTRTTASPATTQQQKNSTEQNSELQKTPWPEIAFYGTLENQNKQKRVGILSVNNEQLIVSAGDSVSNIHVIDVYKDSVLLKKNVETLTFHLKNQ